MPETEAKPKYGWTWPLNMKQAHYYKEGDSVSLCGRVLYLGHLFELGNDQSPDNCVQCKKKLLGDEAEVEIKIKVVIKCIRCGRTEKSKKVIKKKIRWGDRKNYPKEKIMLEEPKFMQCWCEINGYECQNCGAHMSDLYESGKCVKCGHIHTEENMRKYAEENFNAKKG